jgi:hypothetical protein
MYAFKCYFWTGPKCYSARRLTIDITTSQLQIIHSNVAVVRNPPVAIEAIFNFQGWIQNPDEDFIMCDIFVGQSNIGCPKYHYLLIKAEGIFS